MRIFVIGYMYAGKTTVGRHLASHLHLPFIDLDQAIEEHYHASSALLISRYGEDAFRQLEKAILHKVADQNDNVVVSTGGGTPCFFDNMDFILSSGIAIYLQLSVPQILAREALSRKSRPLLSDITPKAKKAHVTAHLAEREPFYSRATLTVPAYNPVIPGLVKQVLPYLQEK